DVMVSFSSGSGIGESEQAKGLSGIEVSSYGSESTVSKFDLSFTFVEGGSDLYVNIEYDTHLFSAERIDRMLGHLNRLLSSASASIEEPLYQLSYLTEEEQQQLASFNDTTSAYPKGTVASIFMAQASETPDAIAVVYGEKELSYRELDEQSNKLAHYLHKNYKVGPGDLIGLMAERSEWLIISILGILKAGAAYLPLDPAYPKARLDYMLQDANARLTITDNTIDGHEEKHQVKISDLQKELSKYPATPYDYEGQADDLAYIMYTSGSTGTPKGVMIGYRSIVRLVKATNYITLTDSDRILQTGSLSFDASTFEVWGSLLNGGRLYLLDYDSLMDPALLKLAIQTHKITTMWFTSSWFNQLVEADITIFEPLTHLLVGGDKLSPTHVHRVRNKYRHLEVINGYGPTENTTFSICHKIKDEDGEDIPLGKPISNSTVFILDADLKPVPVGVEGELYLGGCGLAQGYLNQPELTAERFIANPYGEGRLYKTGDIGKWRSDGLVEFSGRRDHQVKIRGYRIELGEIEHALQGIEGIKESVVDVYEEEGQKN
ncbi:amino acid adenylation domain-containing protein, partial [Fulvivirga kasyanovii]|uniref:non-ribosomal peptide synthetase n=1 Tax=Fulvivirga kasyanovii TaxID=396812 RepID=UPI0031D0A4AC